MKKIRSHFWLGNFPSEERLKEYFKETYSDDDDDQPISQFASDQGVTFYDHDFLEYSFNPTGGTIEQLFNQHSYADQWIKELQKRADEMNLTGVNTIVFIGEEEIDEPVSYKGEGYSLNYMQTIEYDGSINF